MSSERPRQIDYDLLIIGGGTPAYLLAEAAARNYARVGFVPSTRLMTMATYQTDRSGNWLESLSLLGVDVLTGGGYFSGRQTFISQGKSIGARMFVLGLPPQHPPMKIHGLAAVPYVTSESLFKIERIPESIAILGEDALSCSIAQNLCRAGTKVTLIAANQLLPQVDGEVVRLLQAKLEIDGIDVFTTTTPSAVDVLEDGKIRLWSSDQSILCQSLYLPLVIEDYLESLNLYAARIKIDQGIITHNKFGQTTNPRVFLCFHESYIPFLLRQLFWFNWRPMVPLPPIVVNTDPVLASLGMTETTARRRHGKNLRVSYYPLIPEGLCKIIYLPNGKVLGAHILNDRAEEIIESIGLVMKLNLNLSQIASYRYEVPTLITEIAQQWQLQQRKPYQKLNQIRWLGFRRSWNF